VPILVQTEYGVPAHEILHLNRTVPSPHRSVQPNALAAFGPRKDGADLATLDGEAALIEMFYARKE
jgi:hypothetical protein